MSFEKNSHNEEVLPYKKFLDRNFFCSLKISMRRGLFLHMGLYVPADDKQRLTS